MTFRPTKILRLTMAQTAPYAYWPDNDGWQGYPYQWQTTLYTVTQAHGSPASRTPYFYDGYDVNVGDYIVTSGQGRILKIVTITSQNSGEVSCIVEDENRENILLDETTSGDGGIPDGEGILFEVKNGWPILHPLPDALAGALPPYFSADIIARFMNSRIDSGGGGAGVTGATGPAGPTGVTGATGPQGATGVGVAGPIYATGVQFTYPGLNYTNVSEAVTDLIGNALTPNPNQPQVTMVNNIGQVEYGTVITAATVSWSLPQGTIVTQSLSDVGALTPSLRSYALTNLNITTDKTYTLTYTLTYLGFIGTINGSASTTISFGLKRYWGLSSADAITDAGIIGLSSEFSNSRAQTRTFNPNAQYIYFAYPAALGAASFKFNGLTNSAWLLTNRLFINAAGGAAQYNIYRSEYQQSGANLSIEVL